MTAIKKRAASSADFGTHGLAWMLHSHHRARNELPTALLTDCAVDKDIAFLNEFTCLRARFGQVGQFQKLAQPDRAIGDLYRRNILSAHTPSLPPADFVRQVDYPCKMIVAEHYRRLAADFDAIASAVRDWNAPPPCEDWRASDLLEHVASTETDVVTRVGLTIERFYCFDLIIHRWDLAAADRKAVDIPAGDIAEADGFLDSMGQMFYDYGASAPGLPVADNASPQNRLLGRAGRDAHWSPV